MNILKNKTIYITLGILIALSFIIFEYGFVGNKAEKQIATEPTVEQLLVQADKAFNNSVDGTYDIALADDLYHKILEKDPENEIALYQATRVHYVQGEFQNAFELGERYKELYPENKRIHYVLGLANAYAENLDKAIDEFTAFKNSDIVNEAGYLDLAWVYFKKSDFENSKKYLEEGIERFGDNAWLNTSLGMSYFNLGDKEKALVLLNKAKEQASSITPEIWKINYSSNDPSKYSDDIQKFKDIIEINISLVKGEDVDVKAAGISAGLPFESLSSKGLYSGYAVSACCAANYNKTCFSPANNCSQRSTGTYNCSGVCSAKRPSNVTITWSPSTGTVCSGDSFTQTSNCRDTRNATGTKNCSSTTPTPNPTPNPTPTSPTTPTRTPTSPATPTRTPTSPTTPTPNCTVTSWSPSAYTVCSGNSFTQTNNCGGTRSWRGAKNCCVSYAGRSCVSRPNICGKVGYGTYSCYGGCSARTPAAPPWVGPTAAQVCVGSVATQERCGDIKNEEGIKNCTVCTDTTWSGPDPATICSGIEFVQTKCGESRIKIGTKTSCGAPSKKLNLECSIDKINWNDCTNVIKLSHKNVPFYIRNYLTDTWNRKSYCSASINLHGDASANLPGLKFTEINNKFSQVNVVGNNIPSIVFEKKVFGACQYSTASKDLKIKIIDIDIEEV